MRLEAGPFQNVGVSMRLEAASFQNVGCIGAA